MRHRTLLLLAVLSVSAGCTHRQLASSTVLTAGTVMDIHYRTVLNNLALFSCQPEALPNHIRLADGVVQINDQAGFGGAGGFTAFTSSRIGIDRFGPAASRGVSEQWGSDAIGDPRDLKALQDLYRTALGLPTLPNSEAIDYLNQQAANAASGSGSSGGGGSGSGGSGGGGTPQVPVEVLLRDVPPPGWYHCGRRCDVPRDACYVGRCGDRYVWVTAAGMPRLSRFTLAVLGVLKYQPNRREPTSSLVETGG